MDHTWVAQALRNAVEAEFAASRFYNLLAESTSDQEVKVFLETMARAEVAHAKAIEEAGKRIAEGPWPLRADEASAAIETVPSWKYVDGITLEQALEVAIEAEHQAALAYDAIADYLPEKAGAFFRSLSETEEQHASELLDLRKERFGST